jgi:hypothetical protein
VVAGRLEPRPEFPDPAHVWLKFENGLVGGSWQSRAFVDFTLREGEAKEGKFYTNKGVWKGTFGAAQLRTHAGTISGTVSGTVDSGRAKPGRYSFEIDGTQIGTVAAGRFTTRLEGKKVKHGMFVGGIEPVKQTD